MVGFFFSPPKLKYKVLGDWNKIKWKLTLENLFKVLIKYIVTQQ